MPSDNYNIDLSLFKLAIDQGNTFAMLNEHGRYIYVNSAWEQAIGRTMEEVAGRRVEEIISDTNANLAMQTGRQIVGHPVKKFLKEPQYTTYTPLYRDGKMIGCAIQTIFSRFNEAIEFSYTLNKMQNERNFYQQELRRLRGAKYSIDNIIGESKQALKLKDMVRLAAASSSNVLLEGETGTGKELVAHSLHDLSARSLSPFVKVNCAAIPSELAESELFGYEYGAFTGAKKDGKQGKFEVANNGSLFLDEINHMSMMVQPKLLRVLQEQEIERVGGTKSIPINVRLIAATNVPLEQLIEKDLFRSDLYYRLDVIKIHLPALRERLEDLPMLAESIVKKLNEQLGMHVEGISADALRRLQKHNWPGNIRELQNVIERAMNVRLNGTLIWADFVDSLNARILHPCAAHGNTQGSLHSIKEQTEKTMISNMLQSCNGNKKLTAEKLGISRTLLYRKIKKYEIE